MSATTDADTALDRTSAAALQKLAREHLWMHFTPLGQFDDDHPIPMIVKGEGCYVWDDEGRRYLDGFASLFCTQIGHGRADVAQAGADQGATLAYFNNWGYAHPPAVELATLIAEMAPGDLNRVFFTNSGSEAVETAYKLARQYHKLHGKPNKTKLIAREIAYHGTTFGALSATGLTPYREPFEPLTPGSSHVPCTNLYRKPEWQPVEEYSEAIRRRIEFEGPDTVAAVILEPVQNAGGCLVPPEGYFQRVREICDEYDVLLISDETICAWGRLGTMFGCERFDYVPDILTTAKGLTSGYAPMGCVVVSDKVSAPFLRNDGSTFMHGATWGGHPIAAAVALANLGVFRDEDLIGHVQANEANFKAMVESLSDLPIVGDVRGIGYFWAIELVKDKATKESFNEEESDQLLDGFLSTEFYNRGLICRSDDRGDPVVQLAPPLIAGPEQFAEIEAVLRPVLKEAGERMGLAGA
jgi:adenosylmethionine-8-amino-7-oxononanoate aminotransferase